MPEEQNTPLELRGGRSRSNSTPARFLSRFFRPHHHHQQQQQQPSSSSHHHHRSRRSHHQDPSPPQSSSSHNHHPSSKPKHKYPPNPNPSTDHVYDIPLNKKPSPRHRNPFFRPRPPKPKHKKSPSSNIGTPPGKKRSLSKAGSRISTSTKPAKTRLTLDLKPLLDSNPSFLKLSFQFRSSSGGLAVDRVERFIRDELKSEKQAVVKLFTSSGKQLETGAQIPSSRGRSSRVTVWYRLEDDNNNNNNNNPTTKWEFSVCINNTQKMELNKLIEEDGATVGEVRRQIAGYLGIKEPRRIRVYADDGMFHGFLQGEGWVLRELGKRWLTRYLAVHVRHREGWVEVRLKGWGNERAGRRYVVHPGSGEGKWTVRDLKVNFVTGGLVNVTEGRGRSRLSRKGLLGSGGLRVRFDGRRVGETEGVVWGGVYEVEFGGVEEAEVFAGEEGWLLRETESCDVCVEGRRVTDFPVRVVAGGCKGHKPPLCAECLGRWLVESMEAGRWKRLKCPDTDCSAVLGHHDVKRYATREVFERYDRWLLRDALEQTKGYVQCVTVGCEYGCVVGDQEACPTFNCRKCKGSHCIKHNVSHPEETCKQYRRRQKDKKEQEEASEREVAGMTKDCPKCGRRVNKTAGCNHITCHCGHEWCYVCTASYFHAQGTGLLLCRHNEGCTEGPLPGAELFNDDGTLRDPTGQRLPHRPFFHRPVIPADIPGAAPQGVPGMPGAAWLFPHLQRRNRQPEPPVAPAPAAPEEPPAPAPEPGHRDPPLMTGANPGLVRGTPPPWAPGMAGARPRMRGTGAEAARRARGLGFHV
ncbi:uncharacterized protein QC761_109900 [Podospora bellae-mahoneyi]|uniref:RBR-type E3 ubiquitin transferase n=1 Tax=Podospora bellae-mahoneyi TaxID=2093777 RepID=A0ABR0FY35_9PEZI|nr:hypothetical protein QC761_109900 [Podospora bellae-mahoneyi]